MIKKIIKSFFESRGFVLGGDLNRNDRAGALHRAWGHIFTNHIHGDYIEFGVYQGDTFIESYRQYKVFTRWLEGQLISPEAWRREVAKLYSNQQNHFHGLDTFSGMPKNQEGNGTFTAGTYISSDIEVRKKCIKAGMSEDSFSLYKGLFF